MPTFPPETRDGDQLTVRIKATVPEGVEDGEWTIDTISARLNDRLLQVDPQACLDLGLQLIARFIFESDDRVRALGQAEAACRGLIAGATPAR